MSQRISGKKGTIYREIAQNVIALKRVTDSGDRQTFTMGNSYIVEDPAPAVYPDGIISGLNVTANAGVDNSVVVSLGSARVGGATVAVASAAVTCARGATGATMYKYTGIIVGTDGVLTAVAGSGSGGWSTTRGGPGGKPYIKDADTNGGAIALGMVAYSGSLAAAVVGSTEILLADAEYEGDNSWQIDYVDGNLTFDTAFTAVHGSNALVSPSEKARGISAQFSTAVFGEAGACRNWSLTVTQDTVDVTAFNDTWKDVDRTFLGWSGSLAALLNSGNGYWFDDVTDQKPHLLKLYPDKSNSGLYYTGIAFLGWSGETPHDGAVTQTVNIIGKHMLKKKTA